jgi:hypothetical protein
MQVSAHTELGISWSEYVAHYILSQHTGRTSSLNIKWLKFRDMARIAILNLISQLNCKKITLRTPPTHHTTQFSSVMKQAYALWASPFYLPSLCHFDLSGKQPFIQSCYLMCWNVVCCVHDTCVKCKVVLQKEDSSINFRMLPLHIQKLFTELQIN